MSKIEDEYINDLEQLESINNLLSAENDVSDAKRNLQSSILRYLLETGQLRVDDKNLVKIINKNTPVKERIEVAP